MVSNYKQTMQCPVDWYENSRYRQKGNDCKAELKITYKVDFKFQIKYLMAL